MTTSEVFGRPIKGEIRPTSERQQKQDDPMDLIKALDELLDLPGVIEYKWTQYTPYWNDGEECEFSVLTDWQAGVKLEFGDPDEGEHEDGYYTSLSRVWRRSHYENVKEINGVDVTEHAQKLSALNGEVGCGSHYVWLKETFGDHATVIANKEGFKVEFYDHD
jgi:hypothetical protein